MIKNPLPKGQLEIVVGDRYKVEGDDYKYECHIYLNKGAELHGGIGKTPEEALFNAVSHWRMYEDKKEPAG